MATYMIFHEVEDVGHWLASPRREEFFGPLGITARTFVDPQQPGRVGLLAEIPDMDAFQAMLQSEAGVAAMQHDGVRPETIVLLAES